MKKFLMVLLAVVTAVTIACEDKLSITPVSVVSQETLLNEEGIEYTIAAMYSTLYHSDLYYTLANIHHGDMIGGNANKGSTANDQASLGELEGFTFNSTNPYISLVWNYQYDGVFRANLVLDMLQKMEDQLDKSYFLQAQAQARFMRGLWYLELIKFFGAAVPWVGLEEYQYSSNPMVSNVDEKGDYIYIWDNVIEDFQFAYDNLPDDWTSNGEIGRANKWAALAYKVKVMVFQSSPYLNNNGTKNRWSEVKTDLENLMTNGKTPNGLKYKMTDTYGELFDASTSDNTSENVFEIQQGISGTDQYGNSVYSYMFGLMFGVPNMGNGWSFDQPTQDLAQSYMVDANGLPYLNNGYRSFTAVSQRDGAVVNTDLSVYMDPRIDFTIGRFGVPFLDWDVPIYIEGIIREVTYGGIYFNKKTLPRNADKGSLSLVTRCASSTKNVHLIRYADILLWYAEALINTGNPADAREYVNMVRERAGNSYIKAAEMSNGWGSTMNEIASPYILDNQFDNSTSNNAAANYRIGPWPIEQFATADDAMEAVMLESRAEFAYEGRRWFDLTRWGVVSEELNRFASYESNFLTRYNSAIYPEKAICFPIPSNEILTMEGLLVQNETWK